ncbi:MAG: hypothetical protein KGO50_05945 [Myxococcales bacterium]|nr:hypothetical protein [Myxococcales bacterium]
MKTKTYSIYRALSVALLLPGCVTAGVADEASNSEVTPITPTAIVTETPTPDVTDPHPVTPDHRDPCAPFVLGLPPLDQPAPASDSAGVQQVAWLLRSVEADGVNRAAEWLDTWPRTESGWAARLAVLRTMNPGTALDAVIPNASDRRALTDYVLARLANTSGAECTRDAIAWTRLLVWPLGSTRTDDTPLGATLDQAIQTCFEVCGHSAQGRAELVTGLHQTARILELQAGPDARLALLRALQNVIAIRFAAATEWTDSVDVQLLHALAGMLPDGCHPEVSLNGQAPDTLDAIAQSLMTLTPASDATTGELYALAPSIALALRLMAGTTERESIAVWAALAVERGMDANSAAVSARRLQAALDAARENRALTEAGAELFHPALPPTDRQERMILDAIRLWELARSGSCAESPGWLDSSNDPLVQLLRDFVWGLSACRDHVRPWHPLITTTPDLQCHFVAGSAGARLTDSPTASLTVVYHETSGETPSNTTASVPPSPVRLAWVPQTGAACRVATSAGSNLEPYTLWAPIMEPRSLGATDGVALGRESERWLRRAYLIQYGSFETLGGGGTALAHAARSAIEIPGAAQVQRLIEVGLPLTALQVDRARVQLAALTGAGSGEEPVPWNLRRADVPQMFNGVEIDEGIPLAYVSFMNGLALDPSGYAPEAAVDACRALAGAGFTAEANGVPTLFCDSASTAADFSACLRVAMLCNDEQPLFGPDAVHLLLQALRLAVGVGQIDESVVAAVARVIETQSGFLPGSLLVELHARLVEARWTQRDFGALARDAAATRALFERAAGDARDWARVYGTLELLAGVASGLAVDTARLRAWMPAEQDSALFTLISTLEQSGDSASTRQAAVELMQTFLATRDTFSPTL